MFTSDDRFDFQAALLSRLVNPLIVHYLESGRTSRKDVYWFVTELLSGNPLDQALEIEGPMSELDAIKVQTRSICLI